MASTDAPGAPGAPDARRLRADGVRAASVECTHCQLPVPTGLVREGADEQFCCSGCRTVYAMLAEHGLDRYYSLLDSASDGDRKPAIVTDHSYAELDDAAFQDAHCRDTDDGLRSTALYLEGVHCTACVWLVEKLPSLVDGVVASRLQLGRSMAEVTWDPDRVDLSSVARFVDSIGYPVHPYRGAEREARQRSEERRLLVRIAVAGAAAGNVMLMAAALYAGMFGGMAQGHENLFRWASLAVTIPAVFYSGAVFFRGALSALRVRSLHMDLPIAVGLGAGFGWGAVNTIRGTGEIYFDTVTALIFLLLIGRWIQLRQQRRAMNAAEMLLSLTPSVARVVEGDSVREVPIDALMAGTLVEVRAGETVPVDGLVTQGESTIDQSLLTGESVAVRVVKGDSLHAGTLNIGAKLVVMATETGEKTRVGRLMRSIDEHARRRAPIVRAADRIAGIFVAVALTLAVATLLLWLRLDAQRAMENAVALLIVTCPCALGLATPLAMSVAIGRAARRGVMIKGGDALERLSTPGQMWLDKTGTLTAGRMRLVDWAADEQTRDRVIALESESAHSIARAIVASAETQAWQSLALASVCEVPGGGIEGQVDGVALLVGSPQWVQTRTGAPLPRHIDERVTEVASSSLTPVVIAEHGVAVAVASLGDPIRDDARATLDQLRRSGWRIGLLSGDHPEVVLRVGAALGIAPEACIGGATPEDKVRVVQGSAASGTRVVMVGDGVNDAAAMAAAGCGVAVHGSAEASLEVADVYINRPGLAPVLELVRGARLAMRVIHRNLAFSLAYNVIGASLAITGVIHPLIAAILMPLSSVTVVTSSHRGRSFPTSPLRGAVSRGAGA